ncbi:MAG: hypothetical protein A2622_12900 [Bdellovibrionales bacterium RIFCSPHIGHO2_01_FULL_40_29]|nr:MAG: hypothetical protein A2622_12900 [Bdellovibrionales bacterium RIFCSPHIGHO2_01_FULL_40_29]OFZ33407.1 MAG: hypothetical protein A3D17_13985 [Bdellovibrionales bacterium RIFCSPHIGHO2_02_FULL_40_15]
MSLVYHFIDSDIKIDSQFETLDKRSVTNLFVLFFLILYHLHTVSAAPLAWQKTSACTTAQKQFISNFSDLERAYKTHSTEQFLSENKPTWTWGKKSEAIYLSHGFIGTPEEMSPVAEALAKLGYTVVNDIIPGHGVSGSIANRYGFLSWQNHVERNIQLLESCFSKIHFIGFSTGALLIHDFLIRHPQFNSTQSVTLYSPFYKPRNRYSEFLRTSARFLTPVISTSHLYFLTHFPDIQVAVIKPKNYLQELPLDAAEAVTQLGQSVMKLPSVPLKVPTLLFVSDADMIIDSATSIEFTSRDFKNLKLIRYTEGSVPHHLMVDAVSIKASDVRTQTVNFISR